MQRWRNLKNPTSVDKNLALNLQLFLVYVIFCEIIMQQKVKRIVKLVQPDVITSMCNF